MDERKFDDNIYRYCTYVGSFCVRENDDISRANYVQKELVNFRMFEKCKEVMICISIRGIKICSVDQSIVYMAHALRRVSYATCESDFNQFAILAREPKSEANVQYCHVFVTKSRENAEELNHIVGNAFQLAFAHQILLEKYRNGKQPPEHLPALTRLSEHHSSWPTSNSHPVNTVPAVLGELQLPPPPTCPPPPPLTETMPHRSGYKPINGPVSDESGSVASKRVITSTTTARMADPNSLDLHGNLADQEKQMRRMSTPQAPEAAFDRHHLLRQSEGKVTSVFPDAPVVGGSTRQPRRRQGITNLFAAARHSAFFPSSVSNALKEFTALPDPTQWTKSAVNIFKPNNSARKPPIFVDLRTFSGGSPVVALKERIDAQAIADAKASAFAEAATVLAVTKLASQQRSPGNKPTASPKSSSASPSKSQSQPQFASSSSTFSSSSSSSSSSSPGSCNVEPAQSRSEASDLESAPIPPVRLHSLRRTYHNIQKDSRKSLNSVPFHERVYDEADTQTSPNFRRILSVGHRDSKCVLPTTIHDRHRCSPMHMDSRIGSQSHPSQTQSSVPSRVISRSAPGESKLSSTSVLTVSDSRIRHHADPSHYSNANNVEQLKVGNNNAFSGVTRVGNLRPRSNTATNNNGLSDDNRSEQGSVPNCQPVIASSSVHDPLHVIADICSVDKRSKFPLWSVGGQSPASSNYTSAIMSASSTSAETPTPTATPTPTQTPQPPNDNPPFYFGEDAQFLRQAPWYQEMLPREIAFDLLSREEVGSFIVRNSATHPDCCALSVRVPEIDNSNGITHYLIHRTHKGVQLKGLDKEWPSLKALITHLSVMPEMLPCPLRLPVYTTNPLFTHADGHKEGTATRRSNGSNRSGSNDTNGTPNHIATIQSGKRTQVAVDSGASFASRSDAVAERPFPNGSPISVNKPSDSFKPAANHPFDINSNSRRNAAECSYDGDSPYMDGHNGHISDNHASASDPCDVKHLFRFDTDEDDEDYQRLSDFSSIMADLKLRSDTQLTNC